MRHCPNCKNEISALSITCRYCGSSVSSELKEKVNVSTNSASTKICPFCKELIPTASIVCRYCGNAILEPISPKKTLNSYSYSQEFPKSADQSKPKALTAFWSSLALSLFALGASSMGANLNSVYGISGYMNNLVFSFISNLIIYWLLGLLILAIKPKYKLRGVVITSVVIIFLIFIASRIISATGNTIINPSVKIEPTSTSFYPPRTQKPYSTPTSAMILNGITCVNWNQVTKSSRNKSVCVYGNVRSTSYSENIMANVITFSASPTSFYFVMHGEIWFPFVEDECVKGYGTVYTVYDTPYIEIDENTFFLCK